MQEAPEGWALEEEKEEHGGLRGMLDMPTIGQPKWPSGYRVGHHEMILSSMIPSQPGSNPSRRGLSADRLPITTSDSLSERTAEQTH